MPPIKQHIKQSILLAFLTIALVLSGCKTITTYPPISLKQEVACIMLEKISRYMYSDYTYYVNILPETLDTQYQYINSISSKLIYIDGYSSDSISNLKKCEGYIIFVENLLTKNHIYYEIYFSYGGSSIEIYGLDIISDATNNWTVSEPYIVGSID